MRNSSLGRGGTSLLWAWEISWTSKVCSPAAPWGWHRELGWLIGNTKFLLPGTEHLVVLVLLHAGTQPSPDRSVPGFSSCSVTNPGAVSLHHPGLDTDNSPWSHHWLCWGKGDQPGLG